MKNESATKVRIIPSVNTVLFYLEDGSRILVNPLLIPAYKE